LERSTTKREREKKKVRGAISGKETQITIHSQQEGSHTGKGGVWALTEKKGSVEKKNKGRDQRTWFPDEKTGTKGI